jgi:hypothetical protein
MLVGIDGLLEALLMNQARDPKTTEELAASFERADRLRSYYKLSRK